MKKITFCIFFLALLGSLSLTSCSDNEVSGDPPDETTPDPGDDGGGPSGVLEGELDFAISFGGSAEDEAVGVVPTTDGGFAVLGSTRSSDGDITDKTGSDYDFILVKMAADGSVQWSQTYGGSEDDRATSIATTDDGGYVLSGYSRSNDGDVSANAGSFDYWIIKVDGSGAMQWDQSFGFAGRDEATQVFQTSDGGYFATGFMDVSESNGQGNDDRTVGGQGGNGRHGVGEYWAVKMNESGEWQWRRFFGGSNNDRSYRALETTDGGFLLSGASESIDFDIVDNRGSYDFWMVRLDASGNDLWTKSFGGSQLERAYGLTQSHDGNYIAVGDARSDDGDITNPLGNGDAWAVKFSDNNGQMIWQKSYGGTSFELANNIKAISENRYLVAASTRSSDGDLSNNQGENDAWIFIIDENGNLQFEMAAGGSNFDFGLDAVEAADGSLVLVGSTESNDGDLSTNKGLNDILIVKIK